MQPAPKIRYPALEPLRGAAALMVITVHCIVAWLPQMSVAAKPALLIPISGRAPVILFFVLSGFVLSAALQEKSLRQIPSFYIRRVFRIIPAAWAALLAALVVHALVRAAAPDIPFAPWLANGLGAPRAAWRGSFLFTNNAVNPIYWTLQVELAGSLIMPLLVRAPWLTLPLMLLPALPFQPVPLWAMTNALLYTFGFGVLAHRLTAIRGIKFSGLLGGIGPAILMLSHAFVGAGTEISEALGSTALLRDNLGDANNISIYLQHLLETIGAFLVVGCAASNHINIVNQQFAKFMGRVSYSIYLIHLPVLIIAAATLYKLGLTPGIMLMSLLLTVPALSIMLAAVLHKYVEAPGQELGKFFARAPALIWPPAVQSE